MSYFYLIMCRLEQSDTVRGDMGHAVRGAGHSANHDGPRRGESAGGEQDKHLLICVFQLFVVAGMWVLNATRLFVLQEDLERTQINVLAVQAITSLVLSAMTLPTAGNPAVSCPEQQPRNKILKALDTRCVCTVIFNFSVLTLNC